MKLKEKREVRTDMFDFTEVNYPAIHFLFKLPGETRPFELMIMGKNVNAYKDLDDKLFKILNNKTLIKNTNRLLMSFLLFQSPGINLCWSYSTNTEAMHFYSSVLRSQPHSQKAMKLNTFCR